MAIKNIRMRPEGTNSYADILHPETNAKQVLFEDGSTVESHKAESTTIKHKAKEIGLEDSGSNFTAVNVEGAMSELFTNVSSGKDLVSGAITDIDDSVVIPANPTFSDLASVINGISTGKKWAGGTGGIVSSNWIDFVDGLGGKITSPFYDVDTSSFGFTPSLILLTAKSMASTSVWVNYNTYGNGNCVSGSAAFNVPYVNGTMRLPFRGPSSHINNVVTWIAYE